MLATSACAVPAKNSSKTATMRHKQTSPFMQLPVQLPRQSLDQQKLWHKLDQQRSEIRQANEVVSYRSKSEMAASSSSSVKRAKTSGLLPPNGADSCRPSELVTMSIRPDIE
jgi:hypothetical protein